MLYIAYMILNIARMLTVVAMCTIYTMMWSLSVIEASRLVTIEIKSRSQTPSSSSSTIRVSNTIDHVRTVLMTIYHMDHGKVLQQVDLSRCFTFIGATKLLGVQCTYKCPRN